MTDGDKKEQEKGGRSILLRGEDEAMTIGHTMTDTITCAEATVRSVAPVAAADPLRPVFHFRPSAQWMNDICGAATLRSVTVWPINMRTERRPPDDNE